MRRGEIHRHVHVSHTDVKRRIEDLLVEDRVNRVHDEVDLVFLRQGFDIRLLAGIDEFHRKAFRVAKLFLHFLGALHVVIRQHHQFHPFARLGDGCNRLAHPSDSDEQNFHEIISPFVL